MVWSGAQALSFYLVSEAGLRWDQGHMPQVITSPLKPVYGGVDPYRYITLSVHTISVHNF